MRQIERLIVAEFDPALMKKAVFRVESGTMGPEGAKVPQLGGSWRD